MYILLPYFDKFWLKIYVDCSKIKCNKLIKSCKRSNFVQSNGIVHDVSHDSIIQEQVTIIFT